MVGGGGGGSDPLGSRGREGEGCRTVLSRENEDGRVRTEPGPRDFVIYSRDVAEQKKIKLTQVVVLHRVVHSQI